MQPIHQRLDDTQGQITSLRDKPSQISASKPSVNAEEGEVSDENPPEYTFQEAGSVSSHIFPTNEAMDEDPTYPQTLAAVCTLLGLIFRGIL